MRYGLKELTLEKRVGDNWELLARKAARWAEPAGKAGEEGGWGVDDNPGTPTFPYGVPVLFGSWAPLPGMPDGGGEIVTQSKLCLWSMTPFDYTRHNITDVWGEWFINRFTDYPCLPVPSNQEICYDFERVPLTRLASPWHHPEEPKLVFGWSIPERLNNEVVTILDVDGTRALRFSRQTEVTIILPQVAKQVNLVGQGEEVEVTYIDADGAESAVSGNMTRDTALQVRGGRIVSVRMKCCAGGGVDLVRMCLVIGLDAAEIERRQQMEQHLRNEMTHWSQNEKVLEPNTTYRLKVVTTVEAYGEGMLEGWEPTPNPLIQTEFAYFRTEGPPGLVHLSRPIGHPQGDDFASGLNDLTRYVRQTIPATVPAAGEQPHLPRPVYRAYDVGVDFNEKYVELMYRLERRDLGLYLYDGNNRPVRDARGRLVILPNRWGNAQQLTLERGEATWINKINASSCAAIDTTTIPLDDTLLAEDHVLDPGTVYEARLVPLLLHEDFEAYSAGASAIGPGGTLDGWTVHDEGDQEGPSCWEIREEYSPTIKCIVQDHQHLG